MGPAAHSHVLRIFTEVIYCRLGILSLFLSQLVGRSLIINLQRRVDSRKGTSSITDESLNRSIWRWICIIVYRHYRRPSRSLPHLTLLYHILHGLHMVYFASHCLPTHAVCQQCTSRITRGSVSLSLFLSILWYSGREMMCHSIDHTHLSPNHVHVCPSFSQGTSNGGRQILSNRPSNRNIVPLYGKSDSLFTRERQIAQR